LLLDNKANANLTGGEYGCALSAAAYFGHVESVRILVESGANVNVRGGRYGCPLRAAQFSKVASEVKKEIIAILHDHGAEVASGGAKHDEDVWRLTPAGWTWLEAENRKDITSAFGRETPYLRPGGKGAGTKELADTIKEEK
jgi:hypothetical protein